MVQDNISLLKICAYTTYFNTLRPRQTGRHFADDIFKCIFLNENASIANKISLKFVSKGPINNIPALVQIMAWRRSGDKPLSEPMMVSLLTHICVTRPQWVNYFIDVNILKPREKWSTFCRQNFVNDFREWKLVHFDSNLIKYLLMIQLALI